MRLKHCEYTEDGSVNMRNKNSLPAFFLQFWNGSAELGRRTSRRPTSPVFVFVYLCICVFVYLCICVFVYLYICVFVYLCICIFPPGLKGERWTREANVTSSNFTSPPLSFDLSVRGRAAKQSQENFAQIRKNSKFAKTHWKSLYGGKQQKTRKVKLGICELWKIVLIIHKEAPWERFCMF